MDFMAAQKAGVTLPVPEPIGTYIWQRARPCVGFDSQIYDHVWYCNMGMITEWIYDQAPILCGWVWG